MGRSKLTDNQKSISVRIYKPKGEIVKRGGIKKVQEKISKYFDKMK